MAQSQLVTALLVRSATGFSEQVTGSAYGRVEGFLSLGQAQSPNDVAAIAAELLAERSVPQVATTAGLEPAGLADTPYDGFGLGDTVIVPNEAGANVTMRVRGITVTEDDMGDPIWAPSLNTLLQEQETSFQRIQKRMNNGTLGGTVNSASPAAPPAAPAPTPTPSTTAKTLPPFTLGGILFLSTSEWHPIADPTRITAFVCTLGVVATGTVTVLVYKVPAGSATPALAATINFPTGTHDFTLSGQSINLAIGDRIYMQLTAVDGAAAGLEVVPHAA